MSLIGRLLGTIDPPTAEELAERARYDQALRDERHNGVYLWEEPPPPCHGQPNLTTMTPRMWKLAIPDDGRVVLPNGHIVHIDMAKHRATLLKMKTDREMCEHESKYGAP